MGIDIIFWAEGDLTTEDGYGVTVETGDDGVARVFGDSYQRWFEEEYPRGDWAVIYGELCELKGRFPKATIRLGNDHMDQLYIEAWTVTRELLDRMFRVYEKTWYNFTWESADNGRSDGSGTSVDQRAEDVAGKEG